MVKKVMIVDDERDIRDSVKQILEKEGYEVSQAISGDDCLKKIPKANPDLIIMDIMMPGTPIRKIVPKIKKAKVMFFSIVNLSDVEKEELLSQSNVVGFIHKPFDINKLKKGVEKALK